MRKIFVTNSSFFNFFFIQIFLLGSFRFYYQSAYNTVTDEVEESLPEEGMNDDQLILS